MANSGSYNREYYLKNKEKIAKRKKFRYENDGEYRKSILARREQQRGEEKEERRKAVKVPRNQRPPKKMKITQGESQIVVSMYSLGQLSYLIGLSAQTVRKWETTGTIPPATYRSKGGHRLYTDAQVQSLKEVFAKHKSLEDPWRITEEFKKDVYEAWSAIGNPEE